MTKPTRSQTVSSSGKQAGEAAMGIQIQEVNGIAQHVVNGFVMRKAIPSREKEDVVQEVIRKYLEKEEKINGAYKGDANPKTYLTAIFYRMCCEIIRSGYKSWDQIKREDPGVKMMNFLTSTDTHNQFVISNEAEYLKKIFNMFDDEKARIILFLKFFFGLTVLKDDLKAYNPRFARLGLDKIVYNHKPGNNQQTFDLLARLVNKSENSGVKHDAVRIWLYKRMDQVISRLNGPMNRANYDRDTFRLLFEYVYAEEK